jgi:hypothetical protein
MGCRDQWTTLKFVQMLPDCEDRLCTLGRGQISEHLNNSLLYIGKDQQCLYVRDQSREYLLRPRPVCVPFRALTHAICGVAQIPTKIIGLTAQY